MSVILDFLEWLMRFTVGSYRFGFDGVWHYLLVGVCTGLVIAAINILGEGGVSRKDLTTWGWDQTIFVVSRFLAGFFLWPLFLFLMPALVPVVMLFLLAMLAMLVFGWLASLWPRKATG